MTLGDSSIGFALGATVGIILAITGAGGGVLAVPILIFVLGLPVHKAAPIALFTVGVAATFGALIGLREGTVRYRAALLIGGVGMLAAPIGSALARVTPSGPLMVLFAVVLAYSARSMYQRSQPGHDLLLPPHPRCELCTIAGRLLWTRPCARALALIGACSGLLSGLLGVGGGFVIVPALTRFTGMSARNVVNTSLLVIALVSVAGTGSAVVHDLIVWSVAGPFCGGAAGALLIGRRYLSQMSGASAQRSFAALSFVAAILLAWHGLHAMVG